MDKYQSEMKRSPQPPGPARSATARVPSIGPLKLRNL